MTNVSVFEAIHSQRSIRAFASDAVPDEAITKIIEAATRAPSRGNSQPWHFLVVRDGEMKHRIGEQHWYSTVEGRRAATPEWLSSSVETPGDYLAQHMEEVPVLILVCIDSGAVAQLEGAAAKSAFTGGASIYPAVQNLMLAARGLGLGTGPITLYRRGEEKVKALLGIPTDVEIAALILLGYPGEGEHFGGSRRKPAKEVTFSERWGQRNP